MNRRNFIKLSSVTATACVVPTALITAISASNKKGQIDFRVYKGAQCVFYNGVDFDPASTLGDCLNIKHVIYNSDTILIK